MNNDYYYSRINRPDNTMIIVVCMCMCLIVIGITVWFVFFSGAGSSGGSSGGSSAKGNPTSAEIAQKQQVKEQQASSQSKTIADYISAALYSEKNWAGKVLSTDGGCGPNNNDKACPGMKCCSMFGFCGGFKGQNDYYCGTNHGFEGLYDGREP